MNGLDPLLSAFALGYLLIAMIELLLYGLGSAPYTRLLARFRFSVEIAPAPGLTLETLRDFRVKGQEALMRYDAGRRCLVARRAHQVGARRMPAVVCMNLTETNEGLEIDARWGFIPFLIAIALFLLGAAMFTLAPLGSGDHFTWADAGIPLGALTVMMCVVYSVWFFMGRSSASAVLVEVEAELLELARAARE